MDNKPKTQTDSQDVQPPVAVSPPTFTQENINSPHVIQAKPSSRWKVTLRILFILSVMGVIAPIAGAILFFLIWEEQFPAQIGFIGTALLMIMVIGFGAAIVNIAVSIKYLYRFHPKGSKLIICMMLIVISSLIVALLGYILVLDAIRYL